jgi:hypothetical protein
VPEINPEDDFRGGCLVPLIVLTIATVLPFVYMAVIALPDIMFSRGYDMGGTGLAVVWLGASFLPNLVTIVAWCIYLLAARRLTEADGEDDPDEE